RQLRFRARRSPCPGRHQTEGSRLSYLCRGTRYNLSLLTRHRFISRALFAMCLLGLASRAHAQTTAFFYDSQPGDFIGGGVRRTITPDDATFTPIPSTGVTIRIVGPGPGVSFIDSVSFSALGAAPGPGTYGGAREFPIAAVNGINVSIGTTG